MSKHTIRKDKTCLNCNYVVENRFCGNCGQENTDTRKSFHHLFVHFFEDLTHYENAFWRTIKNLIFKPSSLTKEYLSGKRMSYLAPVRLYIFISFVTFFLLTVIPENYNTPEVTLNEKEKAKTEKATTLKDSISEEQKKIIELEQKGIITKKVSDSIQKYLVEAQKDRKEEENDFTLFGNYYKSVEEFDSIQEHAKPEDKMNAFSLYLNRKMQIVQDKNKDKKELEEKFLESFVHNLPKALFFYMPLFAFVLWLFQSKKRWYYFDHGIFTLHYFSFLLLGLLIIDLVGYLLSFFDGYWLFTVIDYIFKSVAILYMLYYFFPAHHRFYQEKRIMSIFKGIVMFFINFFSIAIILVCFAIYSFINIK